jgi:hypothetical protein
MARPPSKRIAGSSRSCFVLAGVATAAAAALSLVSGHYFAAGALVTVALAWHLAAQRHAEEAREAVRTAKGRYEAIVDNAGVGVALISPEMKILELNRTMREWFPAVDPDTHPTCYRAYNDPPRDAPCSYCPTMRTLKDGEVHEAMTSTPTPEGTVHYRIVSSPIKDAVGRVVAAIEIVDDMSVQRRAQIALREKQAYLHMILKTVHTGILVIDPEDHRIVDANDAACREIGLDREAIVGQVCHNFVCPAEVGRCPITDLGQEVDNSERTLVRPDGEKVPVLKTVLKVELNGKPHLLDCFVNISEQKRAQEQLTESNRELERLNERLGRSNADMKDFAYAVSHDLQEPLRKVHTFAQFLLEDCGEVVPDEGKEHIGRIQSAVVRMKDLIHHLLLLSRVDTRGTNPEPTNPRDVLAEVLDTLSESIREKEARVTVGSDVPWVTADRVQLGQVFQNLIGNALKFCPPDRKPWVDVAALPDGYDVVFSVTDNGIGIEERFLEKIFGVFQRLHTRDEYEGTGIGLTLCRKIVERHGGRIWAQSSPGNGTTFRFTLPAAADEEEEGERRDPQSDDARAAG